MLGHANDGWSIRNHKNDDCRNWWKGHHRWFKTKHWFTGSITDSCWPKKWSWSAQKSICNFLFKGEFPQASRIIFCIYNKITMTYYPRKPCLLFYQKPLRFSYKINKNIAISTTSIREWELVIGWCIYTIIVLRIVCIVKITVFSILWQRLYSSLSAPLCFTLDYIHAAIAMILHVLQWS